LRALKQVKFDKSLTNRTVQIGLNTDGSTTPCDVEYTACLKRFLNPVLEFHTTSCIIFWNVRLVAYDRSHRALK